MAETGKKRMQHAGLIGRLVSDISPDQAMRGIMLHGIQKKHTSRRTFPHILARSLLSVVLRAPSVPEAQSANDSFSILFRAPEEHDASALGFAPGHGTSFIANILIDMLSAAAQDEPLVLTGPTLSFYSEAGAGVADADEFHKPTPERRVAQTYSHETLSEVRQLNLARVIKVYANAFSHKGCRNKLLEVARSNMHRILTPWLSMLPSTISELDSSLREALLSFYSTLLSHLADHESADIVTRLVSSIMQIMQTSPNHVFSFIDGVSNSTVKVSMCRLCLIQRFRVTDDYSKPLTLRTIVNKYLALKPVKGRANSAVPILLTVLINSWLEALPQEKTAVDFLDEKMVKDVPECLVKRILRRNCEIVKRYTETPKGDHIALKVAIFNLIRQVFYIERKNGERLGCSCCSK